jgi:uridine phosphorylase
MAIIDSFDNMSEAILNPGYLAPPIEGFPETVIVSFKRRLTELALARFDAEEIGAVSAGVRVPIYRISYKGKHIAMYMSMLGGSNAGGILEEIISKGGRQFVVFGSCGVLDQALVAGHLIVPTEAYRDEGTSYHYAPASDYIEVKTAERLAGIFDELRMPYVKGRTWTTDAIYRETRRNMEARRSEGCVSVEMECASLAAISQFRGVELYQYFNAEDSLDGAGWDRRILGSVPQSDIERYLEIMLEVALRV